MSHFAEIKNNVVQRVIVSEKNFINSGIVGDEFLWVQCSYNNNFKKQFPSAGFTWDKINEVFIAPQPYESWSLDENFDWQPPLSYPDDGKDYVWDEDAQEWDISSASVLWPVEE